VSHGAGSTPTPAADHPLTRPLAKLLAGVHWLVLGLSMLALLVTSLILTYAVVSRYLFKAPTDWQDEVSVFMLVGVTFLCAAWVQGQRGHVGIEALAGYLPPRWNALRLALVDFASFAFCLFFTWKSWTLLHEAWVDGQTTTSTFAPPLWIPYSLMALGMSLLSLQLLLQLAQRLLPTSR